MITKLSRGIIKLAFFSTLLVCFNSCLTSKKMDKYIAEQYNNQLPKQDKKKKNDITINATPTAGNNDISHTVQKTSKVLPLIVYWQYDYRHTCTLNPVLAVTNFANTVNISSNKALSEKLTGQRLELNVEQVPNAFAIVDKGHIIWVIYAISWDKLYVEPDFKDLVVSYKLLQNENVVKTGKISIKNSASSRGIRFFQSWKSATAEYLSDYNSQIALMSKSFINKLVEEL